LNTEGKKHKKKEKRKKEKDTNKKYKVPGTINQELIT